MSFTLLVIAVVLFVIVTVTAVLAEGRSTRQRVFLLAGLAVAGLMLASVSPMARSVPLLAFLNGLGEEDAPKVDIGEMALRCGRVIERVSTLGNPNGTASYSFSLDVRSSEWTIRWSLPQAHAGETPDHTSISCAGHTAGIRSVMIDGAEKLNSAASG